MRKTLINIIINSSIKTVNNAGFTKKDEFVDEKDNVIAEGIPYHIHYTPDKGEYYMTSGKHETNSIIIFKTENPTDFSKYRKLVGRKSQRYLQETRSAPGEIDYKRGFYTLYFARQANDTNAKVFEIRESDYKSDTPFYTKVILTLRISGEKDFVEFKNEIEINRVNSRLHGLSEVIYPLQFYRPGKKTQEDVEDRLGSYQQASSGGEY
jgi:hypothetical protein